MTELLSRLDRKFGRFAIPNLTIYIIVGQAFVYLYGTWNKEIYNWLAFYPALVLRGEAWRIFTFLIFPPAAQWYWFAFVLYFLYFMGSTLEGQWGAFRYNLFIFCGWLLTVAVAFITPYEIASNAFIGGSIFLAFAYLYPDFVIYIFFILPVKARWMAIITWIVYAYQFATSGWSTRLLILAAVGNYLLFFARDIALDIKHGRRRMESQARRAKTEAGLDEPRFRCLACGKDSNKYPLMDFRYCSQCADDCCYCEEHIRDHVHVVGKS